MNRLILLAAVMLTAAPALADVQVRFIESAPKDRFEITNLAACPLRKTDVTIDLSGSAAGLIFDVTGSGPGVEVFQPFDLVSGADALSKLPDVVDGDTAVTLKISELGPNQRLAFTIDVDDTAGRREITVSGSEISGAVISVADGLTTNSATFDATRTALVTTARCTS